MSLLLKQIVLHPEERVLTVIRKFWPVFWWRILIAVVLIFVPFFFLALLTRWEKGGWYVFWIILFCGVAWALRTYYVWYFNAFILTDRRLIDVDQKGFWQRTVSEAGYDKIQDVSYQLKGMWQTMLKFGKVSVQTAGTTAVLELRGVRHPEIVQRIITETQQKYLAVVDKVMGNKATPEKSRKNLHDLTTHELSLLQTKIHQLLKQRNQVK